MTSSTSCSPPTVAIAPDRRMWRIIISFTVMLSVAFIVVGTTSTRYDWLALLGRAPLVLVGLAIRLMVRRRWELAGAVACLVAGLATTVLVAGLATQPELYLRPH